MNMPCIGSVLDNPPLVGWVAFEAIETASPPEFCHTNDTEYLAEFLRQNPETCYWEIDTAGRRIRSVDVPVWTGPVIQVTTDTQVTEALTNGVEGTCYDGGGGTYTIPLNTGVFASGCQFRNMTLLPPSSTATFFVRVNAPDVSFLDVVVDCQGGTHIVGVDVNAEGFSFVRSTVKNMRQTGTQTIRAVRLNAGDSYIACSKFQNIVTANGGAARGIGWGVFTGPGGVVANCDFDDIQEIITAEHNAGDGDGMVVARGTVFTTTNLILANRGVNFGKRLVKLQNGNCLVLSNWGHWKDRIGPDGYRKKSALVAHQIGNDVTVRNNYLVSDYATDFEQTHGYILSTGFGSVTQDNIHCDCNVYEVNHGPVENGGIDYGIVMLNWSNHSPPYPTNSSMLDNVIKGPGVLDYIYWDRDTPGSDDFALFPDSNLGTNTVTFVSAFTRNT